MEAPPPVADEALPCPGCGYDLRAATTNTCSECGLTIDPATLHTSGFPWAHRQKIGRLKAYFQTVWLVTIGSRKLRYEAARPHDSADARSFRRITTLWVALALVGAFALVIVLGRGFGILAARFDEMLWAGAGLTTAPQWTNDLIVPWCASATHWPTLPVCLVFLAVFLTGAQRFIARPSEPSPKYRQRVHDIATYASAPLSLLLPAVVLLAIFVWRTAMRTLREDAIPDSLLQALPWCAIALAALALLLALLRSAQSIARTTHTGFVRAALGAAELLLLWLLGIIAALGLVPWCIGLLIVAIDSLR